MKYVDEDMMVNGQPKLKEKVKNDTAREFYKLGRVSANIDQKRQQLQQETQMSFVQKLMLQNQMMSMKDILAEINRKQRDMDMQNASNMAQQMQQQVAPPGMGGGMGMAGGMPPQMPPDVGLPYGLPPLPMGQEQQIPEGMNPYGPAPPMM